MRHPFRSHTTTVSNADGEVFVSLPDDACIKLTPDQARSLASKLFTNAAAALGQERPEMVVLK